MRSFRAQWVFRLALAQVRHRPTRWALLAVGVALTASIPLIALGSAQVVSGQTARRTVEHLAPGDRVTTVIEQRSVFSINADPATDGFIDRQFERISSAPTRRELIFRPLTVRGSTFYLAGTDRLAAGVRLTEGRLPTTCAPTRCEVVLVGGGSLPVLTQAATSIGLVVVGRGVRTDPTLVSGPFDPGSIPLLVAPGVNELAQLEPLSLFGRSYVWTRALDAAEVVRIGVPAYVARSAQVAQAISARVPSSTIERPDAQLSAEQSRAALSSKRFGLLGGTAAALLIGFAILAAIGLRTEHGRLLEVLRRRGAGRAQLVGLTALRAVGCCLTGALLGVGLGALVVALLARSAEVPVGDALTRALDSGVGGAAGLVAAAAVAVTAVLSWPASSGRRLWAMLDVIAIAALGAALLAGSRGSTSTASLASGSDPLVTALPVLAAVTGGLVAARLMLPFARGAERLIPRRAIAARIALFGAIRAPLRPVATAAFLTAAIASVVFTGAYRATLLAGAADQAAFRVPLDARLVAASNGTSPLQVTSSAALTTAVPGAHTYGVVHGGGVVRSTDGSGSTVTLLGVDAAALGSAERFERTSGAGRTGAELAELLGPSGPPTNPGPQLPVGTRRIQLTSTGANVDLALTITLADADGLERGVPLTAVAGGVAADIPAHPSAWRVIAVSVRESDDYSTHHLHNLGEGTGDQPLLQGVLTFGAAQADGRAVAWNWSTWASVLGSVKTSAATMAFSYRLAGATVVAVPAPVPTMLTVATDPFTAASAVNGTLPLFIDNRAVPARIVAVVPRLPTVTGPFVLALRPALVAVFDSTQPSSGSTRELWVAVPASKRAVLARTLAGSGFSAVTVSDRHSIADDLTSDPVGRGARLLLILVAALALLAAGAAIILLVVGERRDTSGELAAWEADGVDPSVLRRMIFLRAVTVLLVGLPIGLITGLILAVAGARLVAVDASGITPVPPLQTTIGVLWSLGVLAVVLVAAMVLAGAVSASALRSRTVAGR